MGGEDREWEDEKEGGVGGKAGEDDCEGDETAGDGVARGEETFTSREEADEGEGEVREAGERREIDAFHGLHPGEEWGEASADVVEEVTNGEIVAEEESEGDGAGGDEVGDPDGEAGEEDDTGGKEGEFREGFDGEAEVGVPDGEEDNEDDEVDEVGGVDSEEESEGEDEAPEGFGGFFSLYSGT